MIKISREAIPVLIPVITILAVLLIPGLAEKAGFIDTRYTSFFEPWNLYAAGAVVVILIWIMWFFRDPVIKIRADENVLLSPASGRVLSVEELPGARRVVRIFMNIFDYHIQRAPCGGRIKKIEYKKGKFLNASLPEAHRKNEKNEIMLETARGDILIVQLAGAVARRIICWKKEGDSLSQGEKIGMIKFGSQVDCEFPAGYGVLVKEGDNVSCAVTEIAKWE